MRNRAEVYIQKHLSGRVYSRANDRVSVMVGRIPTGRCLRWQQVLQGKDVQLSKWAIHIWDLLSACNLQVVHFWVCLQ